MWETVIITTSKYASTACLEEYLLTISGITTSLYKHDEFSILEF